MISVGGSFWGVRDYAGKRGMQFYYEILYIPVGWSAEGDEKYSGKYHSHRLGKYNNVNPSRPTGRVGGYNWRNVNEPGLHGSLRIFSSPLRVRTQIMP